MLGLGLGIGLGHLLLPQQSYASPAFCVVIRNPMMWSLSPRRLGLACSSVFNTEIRRITNEIVVGGKRSGGGPPGLLCGQRREYVYPRSLDNVENIETLKVEWDGVVVALGLA